MSKSFWIKDDAVKGNYSAGKVDLEGNPIDKSDSFDEAKNYVGIRLQQGVPLLDRDWNELEDIRRYQEYVLKKYYIGDGTPEDGFKIGACSPATNDFIVTAGRYLVGGIEVVNAADLRYSSQEYQGTSVPALTVASTARIDLVYIDAWIEEINSSDDPDLSNSQDVSIETSLRHEVNWCVRVAEGAANIPVEEKHFRCLIAKIYRTPAKSVIDDSIINDKRTKNLSVGKILESVGSDYILSKNIKEADGTSGQDTENGSGIKTNHIQNDAIVASKIKNGEVTASKIKDGDVQTSKLASGSVVRDKIMDGEVIQTKISRTMILDGISTVSANDSWEIVLSEVVAGPQDQIVSIPTPPYSMVITSPLSFEENEYRVVVASLTNQSEVTWEQGCVNIAGGDPYGSANINTTRQFLRINNKRPFPVKVHVTVYKVL